MKNFIFGIKEIIKEIVYKNRVITKYEDEIGQISVMLDNNRNMDFASIEDAKRYINNKPLKYYSTGSMVHHTDEFGSPIDVIYGLHG